MAELEQNFQRAADDVKKLKTSPQDDELLKLYGLFKQATIGDNNTDAPAFYKMKESAKHKAWLSFKGKSKDDAMRDYVELVNSLADKYGMS